MFQPIVCLRTGDIIGFEALTRGPRGHPFESPTLLFEAAADAGLLAELHVASWRSAWRSAQRLVEPRERLFLNLDARVADEQRVSDLLSTLWPANADRSVAVEITETGAQGMLVGWDRAVRLLRKRGWAIAVDDVGEGHSGLTRALHVRPDYVKLGMSLTRGISGNRAQALLIGGLLRFAWEAGSQVIAEGVETADELEVLCRLGVNAAQGFFLARPAAARDPVAPAALKIIRQARDAARPTWPAPEPGAAVAMSGDLDQMLRVAYDRSLDGIIITDANAVIVDVNPSYERMTGYTRAELIGRKPNVVRSGYTDPPVFREMWAALNGLGAWDGELINRRKDGSLWHSYLSITKVVSGRKVAGFVGVARDISDRKLREEELARLAERDDLTGLFNRRHLNARLPAEIERARREGRTVALLAMDVDRFKEINDRFGHLCGDQMLRCVARAIQDRIRLGDVACRYGGDEFVVILPGADAAVARRVGRRVRDAVGRSAGDLEPELGTGLAISTGAAVWPLDAQDAEALLQAADADLYRSKSAEGGI